MRPMSDFAPEPAERPAIGGAGHRAEAAAAIRGSGGDFLIADTRHGRLASELGIPLLPISGLGARAVLSRGWTGARGAGRQFAAAAATLAP